MTSGRALELYNLIVIKKINTLRWVWLIAVGVLIVGVGALSFWIKDGLSAPKQSALEITYHVGKNTTLQGLVGNLDYYGFIKNKDLFMLALMLVKDNVPSGDDAIKVGTGTVDVEADYVISQDMSAWELARKLLNEAKLNDCIHGCPGMFYPELLPGGEMAPTLEEKYNWVQSYENCVEAKGQLSSEQYSERTGEPRRCVSPDGREFIQNREGWRKAVGG